MMKKIYKKYSEIRVKIDGAWESISCNKQYYYGEYFIGKETVYNNENGFDFLSEKFPHRESFFRKRKYIDLWEYIIYKEEIQEVMVNIYCAEVKDELSMEKLRKILPYNEYIHLVYDEWNKLKSKGEQKNVASN